MKISLILISTVVMLMTVATILVGSNRFDGTVVEKPYETGLDWDKTQSQKSRLAWSIDINTKGYRVGRNNVCITVRDREGRSLRQAAVTVKLTRPETIRYDRTYLTDEQQNGDYRATIDLTSYGNWDMLISVQNGADKTDFRAPIFAENR